MNSPTHSIIDAAASLASKLPFDLVEQIVRIVDIVGAHSPTDVRSRIASYVPNGVHRTLALGFVDEWLHIASPPEIANALRLAARLAHSKIFKVPNILEGKIYLETFASHIFDVDSKSSFYRTGSVRIDGETLDCFFLTGTWIEWRGSGRFSPSQFQGLTNGIDFASVIVAKNKKAARRKIEERIQNSHVSASEKEFILRPALIQLKPKPRGKSQQIDPSIKDAIRWSCLLYEWLKTEIGKTRETRYPEINYVIDEFGLKKEGRWQKVAIRLTYELIKKQWPDLPSEMTFERMYISNPDKEAILLIYGHMGWTAAANKFLHGGESKLWYLDYRGDGNNCLQLVVEKPEQSQVFPRESLQCSFQVYSDGKWTTKELTFQINEGGDFYWVDTI